MVQSLVEAEGWQTECARVGVWLHWVHQPFPVLVKKREIFGQQLFEHLDTGKNTTKSYASFLAKIPEDFKGVGKVAIQGGSLVITERAEMRPRKINIATGGLIQ